MKLREVELCWCEPGDHNGHNVCVNCGEIETEGFSCLKEIVKDIVYLKSAADIQLLAAGLAKVQESFPAPAALILKNTAMTSSVEAATALQNVAHTQFAGATAGGFGMLGIIELAVAFCGKKILEFYDGIKTSEKNERQLLAMKEVFRLMQLLCPTCRRKLEQSVQIWLQDRSSYMILDKQNVELF